MISVRLALFAEMVKGKSWTPATVRRRRRDQTGVTFLEETFASPQANPKHRLHQKAAQAVLKALMPQTGTDIKGQMRSVEELRDAWATPTGPATSTTSSASSIPSCGSSPPPTPRVHLGKARPPATAADTISSPTTISSTRCATG